MNRSEKLGGLLAVSVFVSALAGVAPSSAQITSGSVYKNLAHEQTGPSTVGFTGAFVNGGATFTGAFDTGSLSYPGTGSPQAMTLTSPGNFGFGSSFADQAAMDAAYPAGTYTITISSSGGPPPSPDSLAMSYSAPDPFATAIPALTAASFDALQDLSTSSGPLALSFNSFTPDPATTPGASATFFSIFGTSQDCGGALDPSTTSCTIDPSALTPGTTYTWELDFSDRIVTSPSPGVFGYLGFDVRTDGTFTTAIPETSTWAMMIVGFAGLGFAGFRASRKSGAFVA